ncbi:G-type lectin S-receptor-like serine/threonine-protein kinase LECRK1 [Humulus lupulus]|uniref:G-type lectin S-receptor-like serine/threonine-protein kinase LECRK1 n=1 Tax=Humulus lupulus TaxID=3486 RepID=UPI002B408CED|nr:G-type lectin S-receptor-like serine/threonine-protein kinase LECRK1 [Humulus lupulus]
MAAMLLLLLLITEISISTAQQSNTKISLGSSISPSTNKSYWLSNSGQFAFGFYKYGNGFAIGIWFDKIKEKTVVWTADRDQQPLPQDVALLFNGDGRLVLEDKQGQPIAMVFSPLAAASASMLDSGNFVLYNSDSNIIWQSFENPTDTLLPGQSLETGRELISAVSESNHSSGRYKLSMQTDGNLVLYPIISGLLPYHAYWSTATSIKGEPKISLKLDPNGQLDLLNSTSGSIVKTIHAADWSHLGENVTYRLTIDEDGILRLYSHSLPQVNSSWNIQWSPTSNCAPTGMCGTNAYCVLQNEESKCTCLPGFDFIDQRQKSLGCQRNTSIDYCKIDNQDKVSLVEVAGIMWENNSYSSVPMSKTACEQDCMKDCHCEIVLYTAASCNKLMFPLKYAKADTNSYALIKVKMLNQSSETSTTGVRIVRSEQVRKGFVISSIVLSLFGLMALATSVALIIKFRMWEYRRISDQWHHDFLEDVAIRPYTLGELEKATNGFNDQVGRGAYGTVFKGVITRNGSRKVVAIKRLEKMVGDNEREFRNEVKVIGNTHHKNLVKLLGYCHEGANRLLVYEYMANGSLADFLFKSETKPTWKKRAEIAFNIARGIVYLHDECETQIIHCDIKPENILMDKQARAKIADFGLAKLLRPDQTRTYTGLRGTRGYVAPEWHRNVPITVKADAYSYGIMLLEIVCCRRSVDMDVPEDEAVLANWVYDCFVAGEMERLVEEDVESDELKKMIKLGLWCIQEEPSLRPSMKKVCLMLEGIIEIPTPPIPSSSVSVVHIS